MSNLRPKHGAERSGEPEPAAPPPQATDLDYARLKTGRAGTRPPFERIALILQGGGALGAYQGGVYQALAEAQIHPDWVAGISIGAINSALIAGNAPEKRVERLREFWETVSCAPFGMPYLPWHKIASEFNHGIINLIRSFGNLLGGAPGFFALRLPPPYLVPPNDFRALSFYDVTPVRATLERLVDFDRINAGEMRLSVGAVNVKSGNFIYFDTATHQIEPKHVVASGSLPPGFPATEIDGEYYWDGGVLSNAPLQWVLDNRPQKDTLIFQLDLWNARGELPRNLVEIVQRQNEIRYSSRTRLATEHFRKLQQIRRLGAKLLAELPEALRRTPEAEMLAAEVDEKVYNIIQLIYRARAYEGVSMDCEFSRRTMEEHWKAGYDDASRTLSSPKVLQRPDELDGVFTFDLASEERGP
jgi:NTE family protein